MQFSKVSLLMSLTASTALAATLKIGDLAQGSEFTQCIKITDFNTKSLADEVEVTDRVDGCCPEGYVPGIKHYKNYWGAMVICGFKDDGSIALKTSTSNDVKTCKYNKCYVVKMAVKCADNSMMTLDGCCPKGQYTADCLKYVKSASFFKEKVGYCLSYQKKYKLEGTSETTDDQVTVDGKTSLSLANLKAYTVCPGGFTGVGGGSAFSGSYELVGDAACVDAAGSHGAGDLKFSKTTDKSDPHTNCQAKCSADATCTGYDNRASGCLYYKIKIEKSNAAATTYQCYRKVAAAATVTATADPAPAPAAAADPAPAPAPAASGGGGGPVVGGKELTCDDATYIKPTMDAFASTFENYKSCDEKTQKYTLEVSGYETELQAGKNGNSNKYGLGMMCHDGNLYYIWTKDTEAATWDALKASPPDTAGVVLKCLIKEGSAGGGAPPAASSAARTAAGLVGMSALMLV